MVCQDSGNPARTARTHTTFSGYREFGDRAWCPLSAIFQRLNIATLTWCLTPRSPCFCFAARRSASSTGLHYFTLWLSSTSAVFAASLSSWPLRRPRCDADSRGSSGSDYVLEGFRLRSGRVQNVVWKGSDNVLERGCTEANRKHPPVDASFGGRVQSWSGLLQIRRTS